MKQSNDKSMNAHRDLDSMLRTVREHASDERLIERDAVRAMIDERRDDVRGSRRVHHTRTIVGGLLACLLLLTAYYVVSVRSTTGVGEKSSGLAPVSGSSNPSTVSTGTQETVPTSQRLPSSGAQHHGRTAQSRGDAAYAGNEPERHTKAPSMRRLPRAIHARAERARGLMQALTDNLGTAELDIAALKFIELDAQEARRLGIQLTSVSLEVSADEWSSNAEGTRSKLDRSAAHETRLKRSLYTFSTSGSQGRMDELGSNASPMPVAPVVIVSQVRRKRVSDGWFLAYFPNAPTLNDGRDSAEDHVGSSIRSLTAELPDPIRSHALFGRLVPVYFWLDDGIIEGTNMRRGNEICLWYAPTPEFVEALPERYRSSLEREITTITEVVRSNGNVEQACDRIAGRPSYLEVCRVSSGAISGATMSPNPASGTSTLSFLLKEDRVISVTLHDLGGRYLRHMSHDETLTAGQRTMQLDLTPLNQGAYLVAVRSTQGEQAVARLIVQ